LPGPCRVLHSPPMSGEWWGFIFLMVVMKVPIPLSAKDEP